MFGLHLCRHPEDVCWYQLPGSERGDKNDQITEGIQETTAFLQHSWSLFTFSF